NWHLKRQEARRRSGGLPLSMGLEDAALASNATLRAATHLGLPDPGLATVLGLSASSVAQARKSQTPLIQDRLTLERAIPLLRLVRALGDDPKAAETRMRSHNSALAARPIEILQTADGAQRLLDHVRALLGSS